MNFQSHERQDEFVVKLQDYLLVDYDENRTPQYLDVACGHPIIGSNTYVLDTELGWEGVGIELDENRQKQWEDLEHNRSGSFVLQDATTSGFTDLLQSYDNKLYDYLSLDVDAGPNNLSHTALARILNADVRFKICTYEHESFKYGDEYKLKVRKALEDRGYTILFPDVSFSDGRAFEDWIVDSQYFRPELLDIGSSGKTYDEILDNL